jgi:hypothetical protein
LLASEKTVFTPHLGSAVDRARYQIAIQAALNIKDVLLGKIPTGAINDPTDFFPMTGSTGSSGSTASSVMHLCGIIVLNRFIH